MKSLATSMFTYSQSATRDPEDGSPCASPDSAAQTQKCSLMSATVRLLGYGWPSTHSPRATLLRSVALATQDAQQIEPKGCQHQERLCPETHDGDGLGCTPDEKEWEGVVKGWTASRWASYVSALAKPGAIRDATVRNIIRQGLSCFCTEWTANSRRAKEGCSH